MAKSSDIDEVIGESAEITLGVLNAVNRNEAVTQRSVASELDIALGLVNAYLKRCVRKGYVKIRQAPRNRYAYYLTPQGFAEKSRLTAEYLAQGFKFFGLARRQISGIYQECYRLQRRRIAIYGCSDMTEIALLSANDVDVNLVGIVDPTAVGANYAGLQIVRTIAELGPFDAILLADTRDPQTSFDNLAMTVSADRIFTPALLNVSREPIE